MFWRNKRKIDFSPVSSDSRYSQKVTLKFSLVDSITSRRQPKAFRGKNGLRVGPSHMLTVGFVDPNTGAASYSTAVI